MLRSVPKPRRIRDPEYLVHVRSMPCCVCTHLGERQQTRTEAHHVKTRRSGGGDDTTAPFCGRHHEMFHLIGRKSFLLRFDFDALMYAERLWEAWTLHGWAA